MDEMRTRKKSLGSATCISVCEGVAKRVLKDLSSYSQDERAGLKKKVVKTGF